MPLKSLSQPPRQVDGVQSFASTQDTSLGCPGPLDTMTGRWTLVRPQSGRWTLVWTGLSVDRIPRIPRIPKVWTGLSSPPHPAQRER
jgi:hypothetical protein